MEICIIYDSKYGNGKTAAEILQQALEEKGNMPSVHPVRQVKPGSFPRRTCTCSARPPISAGSPAGCKNS